MHLFFDGGSDLELDKRLICRDDTFGRRTRKPDAMPINIMISMACDRSERKRKDKSNVGPTIYVDVATALSWFTHHRRAHNQLCR